jgi:uncharacterized membrane protein YbhN (UPF0104 family)
VQLQNRKEGITTKYYHPGVRRRTYGSRQKSWLTRRYGALPAAFLGLMDWLGKAGALLLLGFPLGGKVSSELIGAKRRREIKEG